jgi:hypothetical protein
MTSKNWLLLVCATALAVVYAVWFTDWFRPETVEIFHTTRNQRARPQFGGTMPSLMFGLNRQLPLTEIRLVPLAAWQTNHAVLPLWHLVSASNSVPVKTFSYGQSIRGMKPAVNGTHPQLLDPQVTYRLMVTAGKIQGQHDFELGGTPTATATQ